MSEIGRGICHVLFAYDVALSIDLSRAETSLKESTQRATLRHSRRSAQYFRYQPPPIRFAQPAESFAIGRFCTNPAVEFVLYDFGAAGVAYSIPIDGPLENLLELSGNLYENRVLLEDSRRRVEQLLHTIEPAVSKPNVSDFVEDYAVFHIERIVPAVTGAEFIQQNSRELTQILRAETRPLSDDELKDSLAHRISFRNDDVTIVDWNAAIVLDSEPEDILAILEFANVELMEMRYLDHRLNAALESSYEALSRTSWTGSTTGARKSELRKIAQWQVDSAMLFEGVNNALKLVGDQFLARVYRAAADRFHLAEWDETIIRKLDTLNSIYGKISDQLTTRRMEILEWIIIVLFVISIVLPFFSAAFRH